MSYANTARERRWWRNIADLQESFSIPVYYSRQSCDHSQGSAPEDEPPTTSSGLLSAAKKSTAETGGSQEKVRVFEVKYGSVCSGHGDVGAYKMKEFEYVYGYYP